MGQAGDPEPDGRVEHVLAELDQRATGQPRLGQDISERRGHEGLESRERGRTASDGPKISIQGPDCKEPAAFQGKVS
jgi:hypothetical protein